MKWTVLWMIIDTYCLVFTLQLIVRLTKIIFLIARLIAIKNFNRTAALLVSFYSSTCMLNKEVVADSWNRVSKWAAKKFTGRWRYESQSRLWFAHHCPCPVPRRPSDNEFLHILHVSCCCCCCCWWCFGCVATATGRVRWFTGFLGRQ